MKRFLMLILAVMPILAFANKDEDKNDLKYLAGAITTNKGKVSFTENIELTGASAEQIYERIEEWAEKEYGEGKRGWSRVAYKNADKKELAVVGEEYIVFKSTALSLDRSRIYYQLHIHAEENNCNIEMTNIRYWYEENRDGGQKFSAEEWITDNMALNKKKTKLSPVTGKFRSKTIDLKDELFASARATLEVLGTHTSQTQADLAPTAKKDIQKSGKLEARPTDQLPESLDKRIAQARIELNAGGEQVQIENSCWGGMGKMLNKDVAYLIVKPSRIAANAILSNSEDFSIVIYEDKSEQESIVIECKKPMLQKMSAEDLKQFNPNLADNAEYNMYICEIKSVMMR